VEAELALWQQHCRGIIIIVVSNIINIFTDYNKMQLNFFVSFAEKQQQEKLNQDNAAIKIQAFEVQTRKQYM
jgi:hypothetical protein